MAWRLRRRLVLWWRISIIQAIQQVGLLYESDVVKERIQYENGYVIVPEGPGLGMELDEEKIAAISEPLSSVS